MKAIIHRDGILTIVGFALLTGVFLFLVYLPGHKAAIQLRREIEVTRQTIGNVPLHVAELEALQQELNEHTQFVRQARATAPVIADVHAVINQVTDLARQSDLVVTRLQPGTPEMHASYQQLPFQMSFSGPFHGVATFLKGIEDSPRLFTVQKFILKKETGKNKKSVQGDMNFSIYISDKDSSDLAENDGSRERMVADTGDEAGGRKTEVGKD
jgi:Tfp pilus assembly protein PilO